MKLFDIFKNALGIATKVKDDKTASQKLDQGQHISVNPRSDRYTYWQGDDTNYNKDWHPETAEERKTLSPKGYYRQGERSDYRENIRQGIYDSALARAYHEGKADPEAEANQEADKIMDNEYREKQVSIDSTAIANIDYDPKTELLKVKFQGGDKVYDYPAVPMELVQALLKAPSKGEFFMANIHDQYSMYGKDHSPKDSKQQRAIQKYMKSYNKKSKNAWKKAAKRRQRGDKE